MLTRRSIKTLGLLFNNSYNVGFTNLRYDLSSSQIYIRKSYVNRNVSKLISTLILCYAFYNFFKLIVVLNFSTAPKQSLVQDVLWLVLFSCGRLWSFLSRMKTHLYKNSVSYYFNLQVKFHEKNQHGKDNFHWFIIKKKNNNKWFVAGNSPLSPNDKVPISFTRDVLNLILLYFTVIGFMFPIGYIGMFILRPNAPYFLYADVAYFLPQGTVLDSFYIFFIVTDFYIVISSLYSLMIENLGLLTVYILVTGSYLSKLM